MPKVYVGNNILISMNGKTIGLIQSFSANEDYSPAPASGIGDPRPVEYIPTMQTISIDVSTMAIKKNSISNQGDTLFSAGIFPNDVENYLRQNPFEIVITDRLTGVNIRSYEGCTFASGTISVNKHNIMGSNCRFYATSVNKGQADGMV